MKGKKPIYKKMPIIIVIIILLTISVLNYLSSPAWCPSYGKALKDFNIEVDNEEEALKIFMDYYYEIRNKTITDSIKMQYVEKKFSNLFYKKKVKGWIPNSYEVLISTKGGIHSLQKCE